MKSVRSRLASPSFALRFLRGMILFAIVTLPLPREVSAVDRAGATPDIAINLGEKTLETLAQQAYSQKRYAEAATLYQALSRVKNIALQDDVMPLLMAAQSYAQVSRHDEAIVLWERVLTIPAAPGAHPPGMSPAPRDYRGEANWGIAESRRAQGRWSDALKLYRLNRVTYPRDDGCVPSGAARQQMALVEGVCLENLGRYSEAIELYWSAAMHLTGSVSPVAMRRLVDLYSTAGRLAQLEAAVAREARSFQMQFRLNFRGRADAKLEADDLKSLQHELAYSSIPTFERVRQYRQAARERRWEVLLGALQFKADERYENALDHQIPLWKRREAISALIVSVQAVPVLEKALQGDAENPYLQAALLLCRATESQRTQLTHNESGRNWEMHNTLQDVIGNETTPLQFPKPPFSLRLPAQLPLIFKTSP